MDRAALLSRAIAESTTISAGLALARECVEFIDSNTAANSIADAPAPSASPSARKPRRAAAKPQPPASDDDRVLQAVAQAGAEGTQRSAIMKATKLSKHIVPRVLNRMLHEKRIRRAGRFNGTRYFIASGNGRAPAPTKPKPKTLAEPDAATKLILRAVEHAGDAGLPASSVAIRCAITPRRAALRVAHLLGIGSLRSKKIAGVLRLYLAAAPATAPPAAGGHPNGQGEPIGPGECFADDLGKTEAAWTSALHGEQSAAFARPETQARLAAAKG